MARPLRPQIEKLPAARGGVIVGDLRFAAAARATTPASSEVPRRQPHSARPDLEQLLSGDLDSGLLQADFDYGYTQAEIATHLGCHYSTVCRWLRRAEIRSGMWLRKT